MGATHYLGWDSAALSHVGQVRQLNEDACLDAAERGLWAVADGMGGHAAGDVASASVIATLTDVAEPSGLGELVNDVQARLQRVNKTLHSEGQRRGQIIGSTVVALLTYGRHAVVVWAGDSRVYRYRDGDFEQLTRDHSRVQEMVGQGLVSAEEAASHPQGNVITRAIGVAEDLVLDSVMFDVAVGDVFLLCSDGLSGELSDEEIAKALTVEDPREACSALVEQALARGARDNVTTIVAGAADHEQITETQRNPVRDRLGDVDDDPQDSTELETR
jgi:protein phosphatase